MIIVISCRWFLLVRCGRVSSSGEEKPFDGSSLDCENSHIEGT